jgi:hypothetical protein
MSERPRIGIRRALTEFAVIVVGVLVALWIDAGWSWWQDRGDEEQLILDVAEEFRSNLAGLDELVAERQAALDRMRVAMSDGVADLPADSLAPYLLATAAITTFNPRRGALEAAISDGNLRLIRSPDLRSGLTGWDGFLEDAQEEVEWGRDLFGEFARRYSEEILVLMGGPSAPESTRALLGHVYSDAESRRMVSNRILLVSLAQEDLVTLRDETERVLGLADSALGRDP